MARRFHGVRSRLVSSGRKTFWLSGTVAQTALAAGGTAVLVSALNAAALALRPFTVVRTRGYWSVFSDQLSANEDQVAHYGSIVVSDEAVAIGVTAVPTPVTSDSSSWIHFDGAAQRLTFSSAVGFAPNAAPERYVIDSKSMRKVEEGQDLIEVVQSATISEGLFITTYTKALIKLH